VDHIVTAFLGLARHGGSTFDGCCARDQFSADWRGKAAITGDFVLIASEVNPVIRALRDNGIQVTAVHSHMLVESPRFFFMHFWANDDAKTGAWHSRRTR